MTNRQLALQPLSHPRDISRFLVKRVARPGDDPVIAELLERAFVGTYAEKLRMGTSQERRQELRDVTSRRESGVVCVLELGYRVIGTFALLMPGTELNRAGEGVDGHAWLPGAALLRCVAVDPDYRGFGFSELLLEYSEEVARMWKLSRICLHTQEGADAVAQLYARRGYERDARGDGVACGNRILGHRLELRPSATREAEVGA